jgi:hypothetical protein
MVTINRISFPPNSSWVYAYMECCDGELAVWFKNHKGVPSVCCKYKGSPGAQWYNLMREYQHKGKFVWHVIPYKHPYTIVQPPSPPWSSQCADGFCHLFLNGSQNLTANADNELIFGAVDFGCTSWSLPFPTPTVTIPVSDSNGWSLTVGVTIEAPYPATVQVGYQKNNQGVINYQTTSLVPNLDGSGQGTVGWNNVSLNSGDSVDFWVKPPAACTLRGNQSGVTTLVDVVGQ